MNRWAFVALETVAGQAGMWASCDPSAVREVAIRLGDPRERSQIRRGEDCGWHRPAEGQACARIA